MDRRAALRRYIKSREASDLDWSVNQWAKKAGVSANSVYNFLAGRSTALSEKTYKKLAGAEGVPTWLLTGEEPAARVVYTVAVRGHVEAGEWREAMLWPKSDWYSVATPLDNEYVKKAFGLEIRGPSMNELWPSGSIAICIPLLHYGAQLESGDFVVVEKISKSGRIEATVKQLERDDAGNFWLYPRSHDPMHKQPISLENPGADVAEIRIAAIVLWAITPISKRRR